MFGLLGLIPQYLLIFILLFIILPSAIAVFVRIFLHKEILGIANIIDSKDKSKLIIIQKAFKEASVGIKLTNTLALLETFYNEQKIFGLSYDKWDYFCKLLPNLLITFGLLGTFLGITLNLGDISGIINQNGTNSSFVVGNLKAPLQSMSIAFASSLFAILFSAILTIINFIWNTELAKNNLFSLLEDYLDNDYSVPEIDLEFKIKKVLNSVLYPPTENQNNIFQDNFEQLLNRVLEKTLDPFSQTLSNSAKTFNDAVTSFKSEADVIKQSATSIQESFGKLETGVTIFKEASDNIVKASGAIENTQNQLHNWVNRFDTTQDTFNKSVQKFTDNIETLINSNTASIGTIITIGTRLEESSKIFDVSSKNFIKASKTIEKSEFPEKLLSASQHLDRFSESAYTLNQSTQTMQEIIHNFHTSIDQISSLGEDIKKLNQQSVEIININEQRLIKEEEKLNKIQIELFKLVGVTKNNQNQLNLGIEKLVNNLNKQIGNNSTSLQTVSQNIQEYSQHLNSVKIDLGKLVHNIEKIENSSNSQFTVLSNLTNEMSILHQDSTQFIQLNREQLTIEEKQIQIIHAALSSLIEKIENSSNSQFTVLSNLTNEMTILHQDSTQFIQLNREQLNTEEKEMQTINITLLTLVNSLKNYQENLNIDLEVMKLGDRLVSSISEKLGSNSIAIGELVVKESMKNRQEIVKLYQTINNSLVNMEEINSKVSKLIDNINQQSNSSKSNISELINAINQQSNSSKSNISELIDKLKGV